MLWLALLFPALPLQLAARALPDELPIAIVEGPAQRPLITHCNDTARNAGVAEGQKLAAAQALARGLIAIERNVEREREALHELACWAYQFSSSISLREHGLLIETGGSARLFGGRSALNIHLQQQLKPLGYSATTGEAVTPQAAWMLAQAAALGASQHSLHTANARDATQLRSVLQPLPLTLLDLPTGARENLHALGLRTLGDVLTLPREALNKRFGTALLEQLDRALGDRSDPQTLFSPPPRFAARIELPADVDQTGQLLAPARRLLGLLEGFLRGHGAGTTELLFYAQHSPRHCTQQPPTPITLTLAAPHRDAARLAQLLEERLTRVMLPEPAIALTLRVEQLTPFEASNATLLPPAPTAAQDNGWLQLAETLHARLGSERVFQLQCVDDHRPEHAYRVTPIVVNPVERAEIRTVGNHRPLLIVPQPQALSCRADGPERPDYNGPLTLLAGPERIESGWWDLGHPARPAVHRDYFVARNPRGQTLWIYRELAAPHRWFLHGFFA